MPILLEDLIKQLPSDTEERVAKARDRFRGRIREALRSETRLTFRRSGDDNDPNSEGFTVPVAIMPGVPEPLQNCTVDDQYRLALLLAPFRQTLMNLRDSSHAAVEKLLPLLEKEARELLTDSHLVIPPTKRYAEFLLEKLANFDLTKSVLQIDTDVLGRYLFKVHRSLDDPDPRIELFWGVIGLVARDLYVEVEDLTCVVLAHELAHAFTHVAFDIDGERWPTGNFSQSDHPLREGLAQHYTMLVCKRIAGVAPYVLGAYRALVEKQPPAYRVQESWEKDFSTEQVRLAMLQTRRHGGAGKYEEFVHMLLTATDQLRRSRRTSALGLRS